MTAVAAKQDNDGRSETLAMLRFSLSVLLVVFYAAVCCGALANPTDLRRQTVVTLVVLTLLANGVGAVVAA